MQIVSKVVPSLKLSTIFIHTCGTNKERNSCYKEVHSFLFLLLLTLFRKFWPHFDYQIIPARFVYVVGVTSNRWRRIWSTLWFIHCSGKIHGKILLSFSKTAPFKMWIQMNSSVRAALAGGWHSNFKGEMSYCACSGICKYLYSKCDIRWHFVCKTSINYKYLQFYSIVRFMNTCSKTRIYS